MNTKLIAQITEPEALEFASIVLKERSGAQDVDVTLIKPPAPQTYVNACPDFNNDAPIPQSCMLPLLQRNLIGAIKEARSFYGIGLREAKDYIEYVRDRHFNR